MGKTKRGDHTGIVNTKEKRGRQDKRPYQYSEKDEERTYGKTQPQNPSSIEERARKNIFLHVGHVRGTGNQEVRKNLWKTEKK